MKKTVSFLSGISILFACSMSDNWDETKKTNTIEAYSAYLKETPDGKNADSAKILLEALKLVFHDDSVAWHSLTTFYGKPKYVREDDLKEFIEKHPTTVYKDSAENRLKLIAERKLHEEQEWKNALNLNTLKAFQEYRNTYSAHKAEATEKIKQLSVIEIKKNYQQIKAFFKAFDEIYTKNWKESQGFIDGKICNDSELKIHYSEIKSFTVEFLNDNYEILVQDDVITLIYDSDQEMFRGDISLKIQNDDVCITDSNFVSLEVGC
jgi:hypothetical protein